MIEISNISMQFPIPKRYRDVLFFKPTNNFTALKNLSLTIAKGDRVAFLGVNGSGKTTLLKLVGGLLYPTVGQISVNGFDTIKNNINARANIGFVLNEERSFYWRLTGIQNLEFFGVLDNLKGSDLNKRINNLIELVGLEAAGNKLVATYSSGMKQRLALARGLLSNPPIIILDEPTRTLDPEAVKNVRTLICKIHDDQERTLLIATHKFDEVEELCNKVCIIRNGQLLSYDNLSDIYSNYGTIENYYQTIMVEKELQSI